ncbi:MAG: hypothetical protein IPL61_08495 [Myxococcales bacterium]|nr:hypothetical protein [Myxococcales bacterium]
MRTLSLSLSLVTALAVAATACGSDDTLTASDFIADYGGGVCAKAFECMSTFPGTPAEFSASFGASEAACPGTLGIISGAQLQTSVDAGRVIFDATLGGQCVSAIAAFTCPNFWTASAPPAACSTALMGTVAVGGTCTIGAECVSGACDGTCLAPGVTGGASDAGAAVLASHAVE